MGKKGETNRTLSPETKTFVIGCKDEELAQIVKKYIEKKEGKTNTTVLVLDKQPLNAAIDAQMRKEKLWKNKENIVEFTQNPANVMKAFVHAKSVKVMVQKEQDIYFSLKDMVAESNMTHKGAQQMLDMLYPFGLLAVRTMGKQKQYKILDSDAQRLAYLQEAKQDLRERHEAQQEQIDELFEWVKNAGAIDDKVKEISVETQS